MKIAVMKRIAALRKIMYNLYLVFIFLNKVVL